MSVINAWVGALAHDSVRVRAQLDSGATDVSLVVSENPDLSDPDDFGPVSPSAQDVATLDATSLDPDTQYFYAVDIDGELSTTPGGLVLAGASGDYAATPDDASLDITGDIDLRAEVTIDDWTDAAPDGTRATFCGKWDGSDRSYFFGVEDDGALRLFWSTDGSDSVLRSSTASVPVTTGRLAVRATLDADNDASGHDVTFYTGPSIAGPWTQLGAVVTNAGTASMFSGTAEASAGAVDGGTGRPFAGIIHAVEVYDGIDGTLVTNPVFEDQPIGQVAFDDSAGLPWTVEGDGTIRTALSGAFRTAAGPAGDPIPFTFIASGDAGLNPDFPGATGDVLASHRLSDAPTFDTMRERAPLFVVNAGDTPYYDLGSDGHGIVGGGSLANYRRQWNDVLLQPRAHELFRSIPQVYVWDDHDFGPNNSDGTLATKENAADVYRERVPSYTLPDSDAIYHDFRVGRVQFAVWDCRYYRSPNSDPDDASKTMLGTAQKTWFQDLLETSTAELLVIVSSVRWLDGGSDSWPGFATERQELADLLVSTGWTNHVVMINADVHVTAFDSGANNQWGGFPVYVVGPIDATPLSVTPVYDVGVSAARDQYGEFAVTDDDDVLTFTATALAGDDVLFSHGLTLGSPPIFVPDTVAPLLTGSHTVRIEARVCTEYQTGIDPDGVPLPVIDGDVRLDGTASIRGTADVRTPGVNEQSGRSAFPRGKDTLLNPLTGNEVFIRYGIELSADVVLWTPLGYYRLSDGDQADTSDGPIRLMCQDRMSTLVESDLLAPRIYQADTTIAAVFNDLVKEIYPDAVIGFDGGAGFATLGRQLVIEKKRYEGLYELATSLGKIMYWDREGILRVVDAPDEDDIVWEVKSGHQGVLTGVNRSVTRDGTFNAWVVTGEGGDASVPARGVATDANPNSLTNFETSRFGKVPHFFESPAVTTDSQAADAARAGLRRTLGAAFMIDFNAVTNPALEPWQAVRVTHKDGNRDVHIVESLTIPLHAGTAMSATTRDKSLIVIGGGINGQVG